jgi:molecular chaperone GrpE
MTDQLPPEEPEDEVVAAAEEILAAEPDLEPVEIAIAERDQYLDDLRRLQAEFENFRKRSIKQQTDLTERAGENLVRELLGVLDIADLARTHGADDQVGNALGDALRKEGLERLDPVGEPFDPAEHDAVMHEAGDGEPEVIEVMRAGYRWRGRLLRPAMVKVKGG